MQLVRPTILILSAACVLGSAPPAGELATAPRGAHASMWEAHRLEPPFPPGPPPTAEVLAAARAWEQTRPHASRSDIEVFGYLPYWVSGPDGLRYDVLTQVNYFGAHVEPDGELSNLNGWGDEATEQLVTMAHAEGCRVCLTVANFDDDEIHDLVTDPSARAAAISALLDEVLAMDADGVDVDFEGMDSVDKPYLVTFMQEMQAEFEAAMSDPWITLATPAVDWSGAYDYDELMYASNGLFFMGYGYHWSAGDPGPLAPKEGSTTWGSYSLAWSIEDYIEYGGYENRHEIIMGLPLYGRDWPSTSDAIPGEATATSDAVTYTSCATGAAQHGEQWDADSTTPYYMFEEYITATDEWEWHQVWYDHADSLLSKIELVVDYDIGGFGFWALQFDGNDPDLWDGIAELVGDDDDAADDDAADDDASDDDVSDDDTAMPDDDADDDDLGPNGFPPPHLEPGSGDDGCSCSAEGRAAYPAAGLLVLGLVGLRRRQG